MAGGQLSGATQYYDDIYVPAMDAQRDEIEALIVRFWEEEIRDAVPVDTYTIDLGLTPDLSKARFS